MAQDIQSCREGLGHSGFARLGKFTSHTSHFTLHTSHLTPHTSHLTPHTSHLTHTISHLTPHTSHLTLHTSHLTLHSLQIMPPQAKAHEANIREMREGNGGAVARITRQLKNSAQLLASDVERAQVRGGGFLT